MGNSASKAASAGTNGAKSAPKTISSASRAAERTMRQGQSAPNIDIEGRPTVTSSERKTHAVMQDASDPSAPGADLLSKNLASLGQAQVLSARAHNSNRFTPDTQAARMLQRRKELEEAEGASAATVSSGVPNRLTVTALTTLLDARKEIKSAQEYRRLCADFNCEPEVVDRLCRHITSPSVSLIRSAKHEKEDTYLARWMDPKPPQEQLGQ